eukprot:1415183-Ditylum_brightwellii.AAC.1
MINTIDVIDVINVMNVFSAWFDFADVGGVSIIELYEIIVAGGLLSVVIVAAVSVIIASFSFKEEAEGSIGDVCGAVKDVGDVFVAFFKSSSCLKEEEE